MTKILEFYYKDKPYTIYETDRIEGKNSYVGETRYEEGIILIERGLFKEMLTTIEGIDFGNVSNSELARNIKINFFN
jgi:hypothetical protein